MKVEYIGNNESNLFNKGKVYNVFAIEISETTNYYYIDNGTSNYIYGGKINEFKIIDNTLSKYWSFGINQFGDYVIGPYEIYKMKYFWENYLNDVEKYEKVMEKYFELAKDDLFNYIPEGISEEEKLERKNRGWEFID